MISAVEMLAHRLCLLGRVSSVDPELWSQPALALASPLPVSDVLALKASPGLSTYGKVLTKQWLREMKEAGF